MIEKIAANAAIFLYTSYCILYTIHTVYKNRESTEVSALATEFSKTLAMLRKEQGISQRKAAGDLGISQALLSHYENGIREPGLGFVTKVCD